MFGNVEEMLKKAQEEKVNKIKGEYFSSEDTEIIYNFVKNPVKSKLNVIVAPTGCGKTYSFLEKIAKEKQMKLLFIVPYKSLVDGISEQYEVEIALGKKGFKLDRFGKKGASVPNVVVATVDQLKHIQHDLQKWSEHTLIMDEYHKYIESSSFKPLVIGTLDRVAKFENFKSVVAITATPDSVELLRKEEVNKLLFEFEEDHIKRKIFQIEVLKNKKSYSSILDLINRSIKEGEIALVYNNTSKKVNDILAANIRGGISINADTKNTDDYKHLIKTHKFMDNVRVCFSTDIITAGVDIKDHRVKAIFVLWETMPSTIVQFAGRARMSKELDIYVVNTFNKNYGKDGIETLETFYEEVGKNIMDTIKRIAKEGASSRYFKEKIMERYFVYNEDRIEFSQALAQLELVKKQNSINPMLWKKKFKEETTYTFIEYDKEDKMDKIINENVEEIDVEETVSEIVGFIAENTEKLAGSRNEILSKVLDTKLKKQINKSFSLYEKSTYITLEELTRIVVDKEHAMRMIVATARTVRGIGNVGTAHTYNRMKDLRKNDIIKNDGKLALELGWPKFSNFLKASWHLKKLDKSEGVGYILIKKRAALKDILDGEEYAKEKTQEYKRMFFKGGK